MHKFEMDMQAASLGTENFYINIQDTSSGFEKFHRNDTQHTPENSCCLQQPLPSHIPELRQLWKDTFGDSDAFLDMFFETAFSLKRCMCASYSTSVIGALYWFDCRFSGQKIAYIYAVATAKEYRGQGICHALMAHTHEYLKACGYAGAILSPADESLFSFYGKMGYQTCVYTKEITCNLKNNILPDSFSLEKSTEKEDLLEKLKCDLCLCENAESKQALYSCENTEFSIHRITKEKFAQLRRTFLPPNAVLQENENLDFLEKQADFYAGENFLFTTQISETDKSDSFPAKTQLHGIEFLGDKSQLPHILEALGYTSCSFRTIGNDKPFAMYLSFTENSSVPNYLGFAFD